MPFDTDDLTAIARPTIHRKPWMDEKKMELIRTGADLRRVVDECIASKLYALDLETSGLDNRVFNGATRCHIVGVCISPDGVSGYYVPVRHPEFMEHCVPFSEFSSEMRRLESSDAIAIFHNGKFDHEFLQFNGGEPIGEWDNPKKWEDTLILAYLRNTRIRNKGLKFLSKSELQMEMIELEELFPEEDVQAGNLNFGNIDPTWEPALWYGASDAICTYLLYKHIKSAALDATPEGLPSQNSIYGVEKLCVAATRWMERCRIPIARDIVAELIRVGQREWLPALREVYESSSAALGRNIAPGYFQLIVGNDAKYNFDPENVDTGISDAVDRARAEADRAHMDPMEPDGKGKLRVKTLQKRVPHLVDTKQVESVEFPLVYDVLIPDELGLLLRELGVQGLNVTEKSGQIKTSKDELDRVLEEAGEEYPYISKVRRFREVAKAISTNLRPIYEASEINRSLDGRIKLNFEAFKVDTARFSTPQEKNASSGKAAWNIHSIPSGRGKDIPECLKRIREVIRAEPGRKLYAIDYSGQELRVVTNLSHEPLWEAEFFRCAGCGHEFDRGATVPPPPEAPPPFCPKCGSDSIGDLHTLTAIAIHGPDVVNSKDYKFLRGQSKGVNFALCYGGGGMAVVRAAGVTKEEGWRIKNKFDKTYRGLAGWWKTQHEYARKTKHVLTAFKRRYPVPDIDNPDGGFRSKAERNAVNGPIQSTGADLMKFGMGLIYRECKKRGWLNKVKMIITIHDELVFEIDDDVAAVAVPVIVEIMLKKTTSALPWRVPLTVDIECGYDWTVPWNITKITHGKKPLPPELVGVFTPLSQVAAKAEVVQMPETPDAPPPPSKVAVVIQPESPSAPQEAAPSSSPSEAAPVSNVLKFPTLPRGEVFQHVVHTNKLTMRMMQRIAKVIHLARGRGTHPFRIVTETGESLWDGEDILVDPTEVTVYLNMPEY